MDIKDVLTKGHSKEITDRIVKYVGSDSDHFSELVSIYLEGPYQITQRAAWPLSYAVINHPNLIEPHLGKILKFTKKPGVHDAVKRNTVRLLQFIKIPKRYQEEVINLCFDFLTDSKQPIAIKVFSMTVLADLVTDIPELKEELRVIIEDQLPYSGAGFQSRGKKVLKWLAKDRL